MENLWINFGPNQHWHILYIHIRTWRLKSYGQFKYYVHKAIKVYKNKLGLTETNKGIDEIKEGLKESNISQTDILYRNIFIQQF